MISVAKHYVNQNGRQNNMPNLWKHCIVKSSVYLFTLKSPIRILREPLFLILPMIFWHIMYSCCKCNKLSEINIFNAPVSYSFWLDTNIEQNISKQRMLSFYWFNIIFNMKLIKYKKESCVTGCFVFEYSYVIILENFW